MAVFTPAMFMFSLVTPLKRIHKHLIIKPITKPPTTKPTGSLTVIKLSTKQLQLAIKQLMGLSHRQTLTGLMLMGRAANAAGPYPQLRGYSDPYDLRAYKYGNLGVILYDFDSEKFGLQGRVGYQSAAIFGAELEGSVSLGSETDELDADETAIVRGFTDPTLTPGTSTLTTEFTNSVAAFAVARLPLSDRFSIHTRAGLHATRFKSELDDGTQVLRQSDTSVDIAYGLGMNYSFTPKNDIRFDYTVYENDLGGNADSLSVAVAHKF